MKKLNVLALAAAGIVGIMIVSGTGCTDDSSNNTVVDAGSNTQPDAGNNNPDAGNNDHDAGMEPECFDHPTNHYELINGCTNAQKIDKTVDFGTLLLPDGGLPPAP